MFKLRTDHVLLSWFQNFKDPSEQLARWLEQLQEFNFEVIHHMGVKHQNVDALSSRLCSQCHRLESECGEAEDNVHLCGATLIVETTDQWATTTGNVGDTSTITASQLADATTGPILRAKEIQHTTWS